MAKEIVLALVFLGLGWQWALGQERAGKKPQRPYEYNQQTGQFSAVPQMREGVDSLLSISYASRNKDLRKMLGGARYGLHLADSLHYKKGTAGAQYILGICYNRMGASDQGLKHFLKALNLSTAGKYPKLKSRILIGMANLYVTQKNYKLAHNYYTKAIKELKKTGNDERRAVVTMNIGALYYHEKEYKKSLYYYHQSLKILTGPAQNTFVRMVVLVNIGLSNLKLGRYSKAEGFLLKATRYFDDKKLARNQSGAYIYLAKLYRRWDNQDDKALMYAQKGLEKAQSMGYQQYIIEGYKELAKIYEAKKNFTKALANYKQFKAANDTLLSSKRSAKINEMQTRFNVKQKNRKIDLLNKKAALKQAQLEKQKLWRDLLILALVLFGVIGALLYKYNNQKKRANDLLEQKNQEIRQKNEQFIQFNKEKNEFLGIAAHDLRNPLSGIKGIVSLMQANHEMSEKQLKEYIDIIGVTSNRMLNLINDLLDIYAIEEGAQQLETEPLDVRSLIKKVVDNYKERARKKGISVITSADQNLRLVMANKEAVFRILENLLSNALKFSPRGSKVEITMRHQQHHLKLSIKDNGPGIPKEEQKELFTRFSKISTEPTDNENSTGLGLFIVKKLANNMSGEVCCESQVGEGSKFIFTLPFATHETQPTV